MGSPASKIVLDEIKTGGPNARKRKLTDGEIFLNMLGVYLKNSRSRTTSDQPGNENASTLHHDAVGDAEGSKSALVSSADNGIDKRGNHGRTALHNACGNGKVKKAEALILEGADVNALDNDRNTALHFAAVYGFEECVELLLGNGADITLVSSFGKTPFDIAVLENHTNVVDVMKKLREKEVDAMMKLRENELQEMVPTLGGGPHHRRSHSDNLVLFSEEVEQEQDHQPSKSDGPDHFPTRSLSDVGADFFDGLDFDSAAGWTAQSRPRHRHSNSMDDSLNKAMPPDRLAHLARIDPKRAQRILANRQSAARSKERKVQYTSELERKVQTLQSEATNLSAQVTMLQRDSSGLTAENKELKYKLQAMEQQAHLRDALNEALRDEVQRLKIVAGHTPAANGFNRALPPQFSSRPTMFQNFTNNQNQHINISQFSNNQTPSSQPKPTFLDFNHRVM